MNLRSGERDGYHWLWWQGGRLGDVVRRVPDLVVGQVVAITSCDSGPVRPSPEERDAGWTTQGDVAWTSPIRSPSELPRGEFDEWTVFPSRRDLPELEVFVNDSNFLPFVLPERDEAAPFAAAITERFWSQLTSLDATSFLAEGLAMTVVTKNPSWHARCLEGATA